MTCPYPDGCTRTVETTTTTIAKAIEHHGGFAYTGDAIALTVLMALFIIALGAIVIHWEKRK